MSEYKAPFRWEVPEHGYYVYNILDCHGKIFIEVTGQSSPDKTQLIVTALNKKVANAPAINAEALAEKIDLKYEDWKENDDDYYPGEAYCQHPGKDKVIKEIAQLITDGIDLNVRR